jgi:hypothetical protein
MAATLAGFYTIRGAFRACSEPAVCAHRCAKVSAAGVETSDLTPQFARLRAVSTGFCAVCAVRFVLLVQQSLSQFSAGDDCTIAFTRFKIGVCVWWNESVTASPLPSLPVVRVPQTSRICRFYRSSRFCRCSDK